MTQPERELLSNRYGSRTMLPTLYTSQLSLTVLVDPLGHYKQVLRRRAIHITKSRMNMIFGETTIAEVSEL